MAICTAQQPDGCGDTPVSDDPKLTAREAGEEALPPPRSALRRESPGRERRRGHSSGLDGGVCGQAQGRDRRKGRPPVVFWTADTGIDGQAPVDLDELDLIGINPLPSWVWYQDMADFAEAITDERAGRRLARAIQGKGAFRRFKDELHEEYPDLLPAWYAFRDARAERRAVQWLAGNSLIDGEAASRFLAVHTDPGLP